MRRFREFVVFSPEQIPVEYLVAFQLKNTLCHCHMPVTAKTVVAIGANRGRPCQFCNHSKKDPRNCRYYAVLPVCCFDRMAKMND